MAQSRSPEEKQRLEALRQAEKGYVAALKDAEKALGNAQHAHERRVRDADAELNRVRNPPAAGRYGSVTLWEDRIETGSGGISLLHGPVQASVEARGDVVVKKDKKIDTRELYLKITGADHVHLEKCNPDQGDVVREFAAKIENASRRAKDQKELRDRAIGTAETALAAAKEDRAAIEEAEARLSEVRAQKKKLDADRRAAGLDPLPDQYFTKRRQVKRILVWAAVALVALIALVGALAAFGVGAEPETSAVPASDTDTERDATGETAESSDTEPATTGEAEGEAEPEPAEAPAPAESGDTGRMSEGEYDTLVRHHGKLVDESLQWSSGYETCAQIGLAGDLAGFRDCIDEAWDGFEGAALLAYSNADDTLDDVAKGCLSALRRYRNVVDSFYSTNLAARDTAKSLDFDAIGPTFELLPRVARRYSTASAATLTACEPG